MTMVVAAALAVATIAHTASAADAHPPCVTNGSYDESASPSDCFKGSALFPGFKGAAALDSTSCIVSYCAAESSSSSGGEDGTIASSGTMVTLWTADGKPSTELSQASVKVDDGGDHKTAKKGQLTCNYFNQTSSEVSIFAYLMPVGTNKPCTKELIFSQDPAEIHNATLEK